MTAGRAELLAIGSELLDPWRVDSNGSYLCRRLGERGVAVRFRTTVGDDDGDLQEAFRTALGRVDLVLATGGLGPTVDDRTREAVASVLGLPLIEDAAIVTDLEARFRRHGLAMPPRNRRQAQVPRGAEVLPNRLGTAPGLLLRHRNATIGLLPGVPEEMRSMTDRELLPRLGPVKERFVYRILKITGPTESDVDRRLESIHRNAGSLAWTILAGAGQIELHLRERVPEGSSPRDLPRVEAEIDRALGTDLFARDDDTLESVVGRRLAAEGRTLAVAESMTGGAVARRICGVPGASAYFAGGVVCYSDDAKVRLTGVKPATLGRHGAVSEQVALEMALGAKKALRTDWGLATTGYAGPEGGGPGKPPGTCIIALRGPGRSASRRLRLPGDRRTVCARAAQAALDLLRRGMLRGAE